MAFTLIPACASWVGFFGMRFPLVADEGTIQKMNDIFAIKKIALRVRTPYLWDSQLLNAPVAQLDRVPDYESGGYRFESCRVYHLLNL